MPWPAGWRSLTEPRVRGAPLGYRLGPVSAVMRGITPPQVGSTSVHWVLRSGVLIGSPKVGGLPQIQTWGFSRPSCMAQPRPKVLQEAPGKVGSAVSVTRALLPRRLHPSSGRPWGVEHDISAVATADGQLQSQSGGWPGQPSLGEPGQTGCGPPGAPLPGGHRVWPAPRPEKRLAGPKGPGTYLPHCGKAKSVALGGGSGL